MTLTRFLGWLVLCVLMAGLGYGASYWYQYPFEHDEVTGPLAVDLPQDEQAVIKAQGRLEPEGKTIAVSALPGEEILEISCYVGQDVKAGQELARLRSHDIRQAEYALAQAQKAKGEAQLQSELKLSEQRIRAAELARKQAETREKEIPPEQLELAMQSRRALAAEQLQLLQKLRDNPVTRDAISEAEIKQQTLLLQQIDAEILHNQNKKEAATDLQELALQAADVDARMAELTLTGLQQSDPSQVLERSEELARLVAEATTVRAPCNGKILEIYARRGERIANVPILLMGDLSRMVCIAEVHEAELSRLKTEERDGRLVPVQPYPVTMKSAALGKGEDKDLHGTVIEVGRLIGAPKLRDPNPLARQDLRTAEVTIQLDEASTKTARQFVHLQVDVTIDLQLP